MGCCICNIRWSGSFCSGNEGQAAHLENEVLQNDSLRREVEGYKQALVELE
jgi:hypothetical protein